METTITVRVPPSKKPGLLICPTAREFWKLLSEIPCSWSLRNFICTPHLPPLPAHHPRPKERGLPSSFSPRHVSPLVFIFSPNRLGLFYLKMFFVSTLSQSLEYKEGEECCCPSGMDHEGPDPLGKKWRIREGRSGWLCEEGGAFRLSPQQEQRHRDGVNMECGHRNKK